MIKENKALLNRPRPKTEGQRLIARVWDHRELYLMMLIPFVYVFINNYIPMYGVIIGFQNMAVGDNFGQSPWVGLYHLKMFFESYYFKTLLRNTVLITFTSMLFATPLNMTFAVLLHNSSNKYIKKAVQTITYIPHLLSLVLVMSIMGMFMREETGLVNHIREAMGLSRVNYYTLEDAVIPMYIVSNVWSALGYGAIIFLGALSGVDEEMVEAARIDGANKFRIIWNVQLPSIKPTIVTTMVMNFGSLFAVGADKILLMQTDLNRNASDVIATYVYRQGIQGARYSFSTAVGLFQNVCNIVMLAIVNFVSNKLTGMGMF